MRAAVISDIHANLPALEAVLADVESLDPRPDEIWCLGDVVGYGADPDACAHLTAERAAVCLAGNHDLVVRGDLDISYFTHSAGDAARWTAKRISAETQAFLAPLQPLGRAGGTGLYHASPRDPVWEYVLSIDQASRCLEVQAERVCLIGHSHVACYFHANGRAADGALAPIGTELEVAEGRWLLNPGSVGQPRDGDPRAAYLVLDTDAWRAAFRRVAYDVERAAAAIIDAGLPPELARRLHVGY